MSALTLASFLQYQAPSWGTRSFQPVLSKKSPEWEPLGSFHSLSRKDWRHGNCSLGSLRTRYSKVSIMVTTCKKKKYIILMLQNLWFKDLLLVHGTRQWRAGGGWGEGGTAEAGHWWVTSHWWDVRQLGKKEQEIFVKGKIQIRCD